MSLCDFITFLQRVLTSTNQKNDLLQTMTTYTKRNTNERQNTNAQSIAPRILNAPQFSYISGGEIFLAYNARIYGGGFRLAIMRVYICGKIFALHNTHIKTWRKTQNHNAKNYLESIKIFRQKMYMCGRFLKASCNTPILDPKSFPL